MCSSAALVTTAQEVEIDPIYADWKFLSPMDGAFEDPGDADPNFDTTWFTAGFDDSAWEGPSSGPFSYGGVGGVDSLPSVTALNEPF